MTEEEIERCLDRIARDLLRKPMERRGPWIITDEMLATPEFEAIWQAIKTWYINVPGSYVGYCGATGNHVRVILDALAKLESSHD